MVHACLPPQDMFPLIPFCCLSMLAFVKLQVVAGPGACTGPSPKVQHNISKALGCNECLP